MPHELEIVNGEAAIYLHRDPAWHNLGKPTQDAKDANEAIQIAKLDWKVEKEPIFTINPATGEQTRVPDKYATTRQHKELGYGHLGIVGRVYHPVQNDEAFAFCDELVHGGCGFESAGSLYGGSRVFMALKVPQHINIGGTDRVDLYIMVTNSHDGSTPLIAAVTPIRPVCANTVTAALRDAHSTYRVRHTTTVGGRMQAAREALDLTLKYGDSLSAEANRLYEQAMTKPEFQTFVETLVPMPKPDGDKEATQRAITMRNSRVDDIVAVWDEPTQDNIRGTAWGAYNAIVEYADWFAPVRGGENADMKRRERILTGNADALKQRAFALLS